MPEPALDQQLQMRPIDWFALAIMQTDAIEARRTTTRTDHEALHHASSCYRRAEQYMRIMRQVADLHERPQP